MICFRKVSFTQFRQDCLKRMSAEEILAAAADQDIETALMKMYASIEMPQRSTLQSAGYDIRTPFTFTMEPGGTQIVPTGLRALMEPDMWLGLYIRSSLGFKYQVRLLNSVAVIDADYAGAENEGHLMVGLYNGGPKAYTITAGEAFAQGIFQRYLVTDDDRPKNQIRSGGFGSTNR